MDLQGHLLIDRLAWISQSMASGSGSERIADRYGGLIPPVLEKNGAAGEEIEASGPNGFLQTIECLAWISQSMASGPGSERIADRYGGLISPMLKKNGASGEEIEAGGPNSFLQKID